MAKLIKILSLFQIFFLLLGAGNLLFAQGTGAAANKEDDVKEQNIEVVLGIDKIIKLDFVLTKQKQVRIGNESALSFQILPSTKEIVFKGLKPGKTSVTLRSSVGDIKAKYLVNVTTNDQSKVVQELRQFLGDVEGLEIGIKGEFVYVGGNIVVPSDIGRVVVILEKYPDVIRLVELSPQTQRIIAKKMQEEIQKAGMKDVTVRIVNKQYWLEGVATSKGEPERAETIANSFIPDRLKSLASGILDEARRKPIQNFIQLNEKKKQEPPPKLIKITAQFVELTRDYNKIFGFKWTPTLGKDNGSINLGRSGSGDLTSNSSNALSATISNLFPKLASAKSAGFARVIQSGVLLIKEGIPGPFTINKTSQKRFGIGTGEFTKEGNATAGFTLSVRDPKILPEENIELGLGVQVSVNVGTPPETIQNGVSTVVMIKNKETAVIGGVVVNKSSTDFDRDPPGGVDQVDPDSGSPLFSFVKSKSYQTSRNQFVVFVTPQIVESASEGTEEIKKKFRQRKR